MSFIKAGCCTVASIALSLVALAQDNYEVPQITLGNGEANSIEIDGLSRHDEAGTFSEVRVDNAKISSFRANTTTLTFPEVLIESPGWLVLHPVIDGRPNGDMVSGYAYLEAGRNEDVSIRIDHPADPGDRFLVMLHNDVDDDHVLDFVFVEDGINVEDTAVFEGTRMIAHIFAVPE
ncbi:MAG: hypothetical protein AAGF33_02810 [Pseudomonadota bacterium]